jgi:NTP pyrophosphatase (non-canonical NTP hydrolase)
MDLDKIKNIIREFAKQRDWDKFHTPKNLSMALSVEASELVEF